MSHYTPRHKAAKPVSAPRHKAPKPVFRRAMIRSVALGASFSATCGVLGLAVDQGLLEPGTISARAVVRVEGEVRVASFDEGWAIQQGEAPGTLVSVCSR